MQSAHTKIKIILVLSDNPIVRASFVIPCTYNFNSTSPSLIINLYQKFKFWSLKFKMFYFIP